jgi:hypothetical protein
MVILLKMQCTVCDVSTEYERDKFVTDHAIKAYRGSRYIPPPILDISTRWR